MTFTSARNWLIIANFAAVTICGAFFIVSPALGYPLLFEQSMRLLQIIIPPFLGYIGSMYIFYHSSNRLPKGKINPKTLRRLVRLPFVAFVILSIAIIFSFGFSNRLEAKPGQGMDIDQCGWFFSVATGILSISTTMLMSYLFPGR
jgi:hypothetical protein